MTVIKSTQANSDAASINAFFSNYDRIFNVTPRSVEETQLPSKQSDAGSIPAVETNCIKSADKHNWRETENNDVFCELCGLYINK